MKTEEEIKPTGDGARSERQFPDAMPRPWTAEVGERLSLGGGDCWVIDCEIGSIAEMQCGIDREGQTAKLIVAAVNSYDALREAATEALDHIEAVAKDIHYVYSPEAAATVERCTEAVIAKLRAALSLVDGEATEEGNDV